MDLMVNLPNSTDGIVTFISDITNGGITLSKGTLINWEADLASKSGNDINQIERQLLNSYYLNHDESQFKIDSEGYNVLCACNELYVRLWPSKHKSQKAIDEINFLPKYKGVIVKEDTNNYLFNEELKLFTRLKYDNQKMDSKIRGDRDKVLYFLKDFNVPSTNNNAESSQRGVKIKQKIGKFRSEEGANNYLIIKSCILTYKKQKLDVLKSIASTFEGKSILA